MELDQRWYEPGKKKIQRRKRIDVSERGQRIALEAGRIKYESNRRRGFKHTFGLDDSIALRMDQVGALGKVAIFEHLGLDPSPVLIDRPPHRYKDPDIDPKVWIRSAEGTNKRLYLRKDDEPNSDGLFIWAPVISFEEGIVFFTGWIYCHEGLKSYYWQQVRADRDPQFYVPNSFPPLRPYSTFREAWGQDKQGALF
ncbi:MAG: hypothetical protein GY896_22775 [Gammaproteobacteria bacterium]|nr:hypothetical protein [Gammaproteobacteria bacterium]